MSSQPIHLVISSGEAVGGPDGQKAADARAAKAPLADMSTIGQDSITIKTAKAPDKASEKADTPNEAVELMQRSGRQKLFGQIAGYVGLGLTLPAMGALAAGGTFAAVAAAGPLTVTAGIIGAALLIGGAVSEISGHLNGLRALFAKNK